MVAQNPSKQGTDRALRAYQEASLYTAWPKVGSETEWEVGKLQGGQVYTVDPVTAICSCPDHQHRGAHCKHLHLVSFYQHEEDEREAHRAQAAAAAAEKAERKAQALRDREALWG